MTTHRFQKMATCLSMKGVELGPRPDVSRGPPLDRWKDFLDPEGRVKSPERVRELVFRGVRRSLLLSLLTATCACIDTVVTVAGHRTAPEEGGVEVPPGLLSMEQHRQGERGHPARQDVSVWDQKMEPVEGPATPPGFMFYSKK